MKLIKNFNVGQVIQFGNKDLEIKSYAGKKSFKINGEIIQIQLYQVLYNNDIYYVSDKGITNQDPIIFDKVIFNIGYRGCINYRQYTKQYKLWKDMIYRCYNPNSSTYNYFGKVGVTVDPKWHSFEFFLYDLIELPRYEEFINSSKIYEFDIATKQENIPENQRVYYSKGVCLRPFYETDVSIAVAMAKSSMEYSNQPQQPVSYNKLSNGDYPEEAYKSVINNPPKLAIPNNNDLGFNVIRTMNGVVRKDRSLLAPVSNTYNENKIMCKIINK